MTRVLQGLSRFLFLAALLAAPWLFAGRPLPVQEGLALVLGVAYGFWLLSRLLSSRSPSSGWCMPTTAFVIVWCGFIALAAAQVYGPLNPGLPPQHAMVYRLAPDMTWPSPEVTVGTLMPAATRTQLARLIWPLIALVLGAQLFSQGPYRRGFWLLIALNGAAVGIFGIVQRLTWNGQLYWIFPMSAQGQPFASFWNRNHAAGYLNLALAAAIGLFVACLRQSPTEWWPARDPSEKPTLRAGFVQLLLIAVPAGVIASLSRGGILAAAVAMIAIVWLGFRSLNTSIVRHLLGALIIAGVLAATLGMWQLAQSRFSGLDWQTATEDGRWRHWRDMLPALNDIWHSGAGLGTYRYANRPYQNHALFASYWNADNEYLELAVEGGLPAVILMVLAGGIAFWFLRNTSALEWLEDEETADLAFVAVVMVIAQGLQAATDFGSSMPANALTMAAMFGALTGGWGKRFAHTDDDTASSSAWWLFPAAVLAACAFLSQRELATAADAVRFLGTLPAVESPRTEDWGPLQLDAALANAEKLLARRSDDPELHRVVANLHLIYFRRAMAAELQDPQRLPAPMSAEQAWPQTHPMVWDALCRRWVSQGEDDTIKEIREDETFRSHVAVAYDHFRQAYRFCPYDSQTTVNLTLLAYFCGNGRAEREQWLRCAIMSVPGEPKVLRALAKLTEPILEDDLAAFCWRRSLELDPDAQDAIFREAVERLAPAYALEHVVPAQAPALLRFAEVIDDPLIRSMTTERLENVLTTAAATSNGEVWMQLGRLAQLQGQPEKAIAHFREAIRIEPLRWDWRLKCGRALEEAGDIPGALQQIEAGLLVSPEQAELKNARQRLKFGEHRLRKTQPERP